MRTHEREDVLLKLHVGLDLACLLEAFGLFNLLRDSGTLDSVLHVSVVASSSLPLLSCERDEDDRSASRWRMS